MRSMRNALLLVVAAAVSGCAPKAPSVAGVAPRGVYEFSGLVDGEIVSGTLEFGDPVSLSGSHGQCIREIQGAHRWGGAFGVWCPGFRLSVRVDDEGGVQPRGVASVRRPAWRTERTSCRTWNEDRSACLAWNTTRVEYDRWVSGRVEIEPHDLRAEPAGTP